MGLIDQEAVFDGVAPSAALIAEKLKEIVGQPVILNELSPEICGTLHDFHARMAFTQFPETYITLYAYRAGAVTEFLEQQKLSASPVAKVMQGANELPGVQTVYVEWYRGLEPTLFYATLLALESLGGRLQEPIPDQLRREYGCRVSDEEMDRRHRKNRLKGLLSFSVGVLLLPLAIPLWLISFVFLLASLPWRTYKAYRWYKSY